MLSNYMAVQEYFQRKWWPILHCQQLELELGLHSLWSS